MDLSLLFRTHDRPPMRAKLLGQAFDFITGKGLFSADRIDDGTRLLLSHLPPSGPSRILDVGCGYGALGLPIAALHKSAEVELVDRDLVAVAYAARNADAHSLPNLNAHASLGYRDVKHSQYDWILCNVPARIGEAGIRYLLHEGTRRLSAQGQMRIVVINALVNAVKRASPDVVEVVRGKNHTVFALSPHASTEVLDHESIYIRDNISFAGRTFERPHDISEEPSHVRDGMPLLLDVLPKKMDGKRALVVRGGYGVAARVLLDRDAHVVAADHDLLALAFTARNANASPSLELVASAWPWREVAVAQPFDLIVVEALARAGEKALLFELPEAKARGAERADILWLGHEKSMQAAFATMRRAPSRLATRGAFGLYRDAR